MFTFLYFGFFFTDCGTPSSDNSHLSVSFMSTLFTAVLTYYCDEGYSLRGLETRTCEATGEWTGEEPTCLSENKIILYSKVQHSCSL